jgi:nucleolar protein 56
MRPAPSIPSAPVAPPPPGHSQFQTSSFTEYGLERKLCVMSLYLLHESASGLALFEHVQSDAVGSLLQQAQDSVLDLSRFSRIVKMKAFLPFKSAENALSVINDVSEGILHEDLKNFLEANLPKVKKGSKNAGFHLGVNEPKLGNSITEQMSLPCKIDEAVTELMRGVRLHFSKLIKGLKDGDVKQAQLGLAHSFSRSKVKFNVNRVDNMIIQAIALLDQLDKDVNTFSMRVREWYSWHFPELARVVTDNYMYARLVTLLGKKEEINEDLLPQIQEITDDPEKAAAVLAAARSSMGFEISDADIASILLFSKRVVSLTEYRKQLSEYLKSKMDVVAPNLAQLIGDTVGARLIAHAGSLTNLAKYPASTIQILGAEKALFRALKTKGNTPKYGLLFHSSFIGRAQPKNKGRISR